MNLQSILRSRGFVVLDGGLATELERMGHVLDTPLWSAHLIKHRPEAVRDVHMSYLRAGADCIISASYQASFPGFRNQGLSKEEGIRLLNESVAIAIDARAEFMGGQKVDSDGPMVAASVGPYGAFLADGSEYSGDYGVAASVLRGFHEERLDILLGSGAELIAIETIPSLEEAEVIVDLVRERPECGCWISFSCGDGSRLWDKTPLETAVGIASAVEQVQATGVNCTAPEHIPSLIEKAKAVGGEKPILVYPNSGENYDPCLREWSGGTETDHFAEDAVRWFEKGARLIGGCCRTTPAHIKSIRNALTLKAAIREV